MSLNVVLPGDALPVNTESNASISIGPGVYKSPKDQSIVPSSAGILHVKDTKQSSKRLIYIDSNSKRYIPQTNDFVIGIITGVFGENYKVQLQNFSQAVQLSMMAFPNASRKNRPNLKVGQAVYARVSQAIPDIDVELECIDATTGKEGGFGLLDESGYIFDVNLNFARELLFNQDFPVLEMLASKCKFEIAIGINGKIWLKCGDGIPISKDVVGAASNGEEDGDDDSKSSNKATTDSTYINDLRNTLAAYRFLERCQHITSAEVDEELRKQFRF